ncbi:MAG TPA: ATP synthase F1 subunit delta [Flavobacteriales bacterium]|nr:ATP synthase F1 subunit delta [Flavobacteriales bacterium]
MNITPVAYRYARSLMELSKERSEVDAVNDDMGLVAETCAGSRELQVLLSSPVVKADKKEKVLDRIFAGRIGTITNTFIGIVIRKGREALLPQVAAAFNELYKQHKSIVTAEVTSAVPLTDDARKRVVELANAKHPGKSIELVEKVDPSLIGGVTIRIGDEQYDGSVSRRLNDMRREFSKNPYIPEI